MPITVYTGRPGSGKSTQLADTLLRIIGRNQKWFEKSGIVRPIYINFHLDPDLEELFSGCIRHWQHIEELELVEDADVFIDEIGTYFDSKFWQETSWSMRRWLSQHRKLGIEIYGNSQDFAQIDISFRRMVSELYYFVKLISSRDPSPTKPPVKWIWGVCLMYSMSPVDYKEDQKENRTSFHKLFFITRSKTEIFNTREKIEPGVFPPLKHSERYCSDPNCTFKRVVHQ